MPQQTFAELEARHTEEQNNTTNAAEQQQAGATTENNNADTGLVNQTENYTEQNNITPDAVTTNEEADKGVDFEIPSFETENNENVSQQAQQISWKEAIKNVDKKELLKELGLHDFAIELNEHIANGGAPSDYISAKGYDWTKVSDADLVKDDLRQQFPNATPAQIERLYNKKYNQTDVAEDEDKEDGLLLMQADAKKVRDARIAQQQSFKIPEAIKQAQPNNDEAVAAQQQQIAQRLSYFNNHDVTKNILQSKRVAVSVGDKVVNYNIPNPQLLVDILTKPEVNSKFGVNKQGEPDMQALYELALMKANPIQFKKDIYNAGKADGKKELVTGSQHIKIPEQKMPQIGNNGDSKVRVRSMKELEASNRAS